jgi:hypothetical protein
MHFNIKLNPKKCTFGFPWGKLLGIAEIGQVRNVKDIQQLMGCLATLSCFVSRLGERGLPLYKLFKKYDSFRWMDETQKALDDLMALISKPPVLALPEPSESLLLCVTATTQAISAALVVEREEPGHVYKVQRSVYYISKVLSDYETHYNQVQKLLYII